MTDQETLPLEGETLLSGADALSYAKVANHVVTSGKCSTSHVQRLLGIGYNAAARIVERLAADGIVSAPDHVGHREVLLKEASEIARLALEAIAENPGKKMKETAEDMAVADKAYGAASQEIRSFIERYERLESEKKDIASDMKEVMAEAKGRGYDTKALRRVIALRKRRPEDVAEEEAVVDMYKSALGME